MIGHRLAEARRRMGLSQRQVAEIFGVSERGYKNYELNKRSIPHELLVSACEVFQVDANWLLSGKGHIDITELDQLYQTAILAADKKFQELQITPSTQERLDTVVYLVNMYRHRGDGARSDSPASVVPLKTRG